MKHLFTGAAAVLFLTSVSPISVDAGTLSKACVRSEREAASRRMCNCLQHVANQSLSFADQRLAAKFFKDPHMAQEIRTSHSRSHEIFWERYKAFGDTAAVMCKGVG